MKNILMLDDLMNCVYAVDLGLDEEQGERLYMKMLADTDWRERVAVDIELAFNDNAFSWMQFFEQHDVYSADSESDARAYAEKIILLPLLAFAEAGMRKDHEI